MMQTRKRTFYLTVFLISCLLFLLQITRVKAQIPSFPGAEGFGAVTTGGRGGQVIYVTNLECSGPGSLNEALSISGPKYILFKVSGIIDCAAEIREGDCYIAGQTSPDGIIVRGIIADDYYDPTTHPDNIILRHLRSRGIGTHPSPHYTTDPIIISGVKKMIVDHCSFSNSDDEGVDISRSSELTIQHCILAETVGSHANLGGMLLNYSSPGQLMDSISVHHNNWNRMGGRMPELSCEDPTGCTGAIFHFEYSCNLLWDQPIAVWHNPDTDLSNGSDPGAVEPYFLHANIVNNLGWSRSGYCDPMFLISMLGETNNEYFMSGNRHHSYPGWSDLQLFGCCNDFCTTGPNTDPGNANQLVSRYTYPAITYQPAMSLPAYMINNVGAFPRFPHEVRLLQAIQDSTINPASYEINAVDDVLTLPAFTHTAPADADNDGMPDDWELGQGLNPAVADHNGTDVSLAITGVNGYTNLECYLNCLADALVSGSSPACHISVGIENETSSVFLVYPNPTADYIMIDFLTNTNEPVMIYDISGKMKKSIPAKHQQQMMIDLSDLPAGMYYIKVGHTTEPVLRR